MELVALVARNTGIPKTDTRMVLEGCLKVIKRTLRGGDVMHLRQFGTFSSKERAARSFYDITRQRKVVHPAYRAVCFRPSKRILGE